jgi:hypothetical protein
MTRSIAVWPSDAVSILKVICGSGEQAPSQG